MIHTFVDSRLRFSFPTTSQRANSEALGTRFSTINILVRGTSVKIAFRPVRLPFELDQVNTLQLHLKDRAGQSWDQRVCL
jgi:hypothetical protein